MSNNRNSSRNIPNIDISNSVNIEDEEYKLVQRGFFVEPPSQEINWDTVPTNGSDFVHKSRLEDSVLTFCKAGYENVISPESKKTIRYWARTEAKEFSYYAMHLMMTEEMRNALYQREFFPEGNDEDWCTFCLGTKLSSEIYGGQSDVEVEGHLPTLGIVLYLGQRNVKMLLRLLLHWFQSVGLKPDIATWFYAILVVLKKPLDGRSERFLDRLCDIIESRIKDRVAGEKRDLYKISAILTQYFCVKLNKVGPTLGDFKALRSKYYR